MRIVWTNGTSYSDYDLVAHDKLKDFSFGVDKDSPLGSYATRIGGQLVFNHEFTSSNSEYGGEIFVPAYIFPDPITSADPNNDEVQVDDPDWLVVRAAAEYARTDITRQAQFPILSAEANEIMARMKSDNDDVQVTSIDKPWSAPGGFGGDEY